ncbi:16S rRNA (cytidine(1402)-2'-O)-methyltransferase [Nitrospira sp. Kam-Ns4a]
MAGVLYLVSLPIGNPEDVTLRAIRILTEVSAVAAEDPQTTRALFDRYGISTPLTSYQDSNKEEKAPVLIRRLQMGDSLALVCDAGTPLLCDPGLFLVAEALAAGIRVVPIPGVSAVTAALPASGLSADSFVFVGPVPRTRRGMASFLAVVAREPRTLVAFETPRRLRATLRSLARVLDDRRIAVAYDLTLPSEAIRRGTVQAVLGTLPQGAVGQAVTLVIEGRRRPADGCSGTQAKEVRSRRASGS